MKKLNKTISWFEIPVTDIKRAKIFYETLFDVLLFEMTLNNNLKMALFPTEESTAGGALVEYKEFYQPGQQGPLIYLSANPDLQTLLDKVVPAGGKVLIPKRQISEAHGFMGVLEDTEGNRIALQSEK